MTSKGPSLSAVFVDYDNIYLSLKRKNEDAAKRFAKDAGLWLSGIASGRLITPTNTLLPVENRRIVMSRCYGNPVPRRNNHDNSTDMNSFPFVRHHFLRAGFEAIDCPPLTAQLKNSADIRMVMDVRDYLTHDTYFDEFVILSGDADFTPVLHRLRAHARRTVIFANDNTAAPYTAIADGEIRESALINLLLEGRISDAEPNSTAPQQLRSSAEIESWGRDIIAEVVEIVRSTGQPVPLEALADRAVRALGHDKTSGSGWGGMGSFRELLAKGLPKEFRLSNEPPYYVYDASRQIAAPAPAPVAPAALRQAPAAARAERIEPRPDVTPAPALQTPSPQRRLDAPPASAPAHPVSAPVAQAPRPAPAPAFEPPQRQPVPAAVAPRGASTQLAEMPTAMQQSIARIYEACQAPAMSPPEYRVLFDCMAQEIAANGLTGGQTLANIGQRAHAMGIEVKRDDVRFVLEVVSEADPWFEQGASTALFASRFRNFVVARCRAHGLNLSLDELDLIESWFTVPTAAQRSVPAYARAPAPAPQQHVPAAAPKASRPQPAQQQPAAIQAATAPRAESSNERWWSLDDARTEAGAARNPETADDLDEFPRIVKNRQRG